MPVDHDTLRAYAADAALWGEPNLVFGSGGGGQAGRAWPPVADDEPADLPVCTATGDCDAAPLYVGPDGPLCRKHYQRWKKHGDPTVTLNPPAIREPTARRRALTEADEIRKLSTTRVDLAPRGAYWTAACSACGRLAIPLRSSRAQAREMAVAHVDGCHSGEGHVRIPVPRTPSPYHRARGRT